VRRTQKGHVSRGRELVMDISTGLGLLAGAIVVLTMIFMGGDLRMFITDRRPTPDDSGRQHCSQNPQWPLTISLMSAIVADIG
jgi:hypothetical protein